jgi:hypothetical protein
MDAGPGIGVELAGEATREAHCEAQSDRRWLEDGDGPHMPGPRTMYACLRARGHTT